MKEPPRNFVETMRAVLERGGDTTDALTALRDAGASMIDSIKVVMEVQGASLGDAKWVVEDSPAWRDGFEARQDWRDRIVEELASADSASESSPPRSESPVLDSMESLAKLLDIAGPALGTPLDSDQIAMCPELLRPLFRKRNGFVAFEQALLVLPSGTGAGALESWNDPFGWISSYGGLADGLTFFAMDVFGGQFAVSDGIVRFDPETAEREPFAPDIESWARAVLDKYEVLTGHALAHEWQMINGPIPSGWRLVPRQPFVLGGDFEVANLASMPASEAMST